MRQYKGLTIPDELTKETRKGVTFNSELYDNRILIVL